MKLNLAQLIGWMQIAEQAVPLAIATEETIKGWFRQAHGKEMTDAEMNIAFSLIFDEATRRRAIAIQAALGK